VSELPAQLEIIDQNFVIHEGRRLVYFGGCDYFRLATHPSVIDALKKGADQTGLSSSASRITTGNHPLYSRLEKRLASHFGARAALTVSAGYLANIAVTQSLNGEITHGLIDERSHASLLDAARFLDCPVTSFTHRDANDLKLKLKTLPQSAKPLLMTDGLFSHDGSLAPLGAYEKLLPKGGLMLVDDAHGAGVTGANGRGTLEAEDVNRRRIIQTITLSKAFGCAGGGVLCSQSRRDRIATRSHAFQGSTPLPLPLAEAAMTSTALLKRDKRYRIRLRSNAHLAKSELVKIEFPVIDNSSPILSFVPRSAHETKSLTRRLKSNGVFPSLIRYPGGPKNGYFRFAISSEHSHEQIRALTDALGAFPRDAD
jgi:8-amino-7-oxononanoate synthase